MIKAKLYHEKTKIKLHWLTSKKWKYINWLKNIQNNHLIEADWATVKHRKTIKRNSDNNIWTKREIHLRDRNMKN
jgi:hypothetical protein